MEAKRSGAQPGNQHRLRHGMTGTPTYLAWVDMRRRCLKPSHPAYKWYGARGVTVCESWHRFEAFLSDMGEKPAGLSLDRVDNDRGYEPGNCRWATALQQQNNQRNNKRITHGDAVHTVAEWARITGIKSSTIIERLRAGWTVADALTKSVRKLHGINTCSS